MAKPIKIDLSKYVRLEKDYDKYAIDAELLPQVKQIIIPKNTAEDIILKFGDCELFLVNEPATLVMLSNYMTFQKIEKTEKVEKI